MSPMIIKLIKAYKGISQYLWQMAPISLVSSGCRFYPTCSEYAIESIQKKGLPRGALLSIGRILRCNPWSKGGIDFI